MSIAPIPGHATQRLLFSDNDCLYRDHRGRRVLAEAEGGGRFQVLLGPPGLEVEVDESLSNLDSFKQSLVVATLSSGPSDIVVTSCPAVEGPTVEGLAFQGSGWVMAAAGPVVIDERHRFEAPPVPGYPLPFFRSVVSTEPMTVSQQVAKWVLGDSFLIADAVALADRGFKVQNISKVLELASTFEDGSPLVAAVASHLNAARWTVDVPPGCQGILVRKTYDAFHGRQRARVLVDGAFAGWWYEPWQNRIQRWRIADFGIPASYIEGKSQIEIAIDPPGGAPLWSVGQIELFFRLGD